ncbi:MAG: asparagine synthase-related protein [Acidimicrobiia bacterium]
MPDRPLPQGRVAYRGHRIIAYCGPGSDEAAGIARRARELNAKFETVGDPSTTSPAAATAFAFVAPDTPQAHTASASDGSFMVLDGYFLEQSDSLAELLSQWLERGQAALDDGRFYGVILAWNATTRASALLRVRFGVAQAFLMRTSEGGLLYGADMQTLIAMGADTAPDPLAFDAFLTTGYFPAPLTPLASIRKLEPGHRITVSRDGVGTSQLWIKPEHREPISPDAAYQQMGPALERAIDRFWPQSGEAGVLLSGGVDSALILAGAAAMLDRPVKAFTFQYEEYDGKHNESDRASAVAAHLGVVHEEISIHPNQLMVDFDGAVGAYGEPFTWGIHSYHMGPLADRGVTTVFTGAGADAASVARKHRIAMRFQGLPRPVQPIVRSAVKAARPFNLSAQVMLERAVEPYTTAAELYMPDSEWNRESRRRIYSDPSLADRGAASLLGLYEDATAEAGIDTLEENLYFLMRRFIGGDAVVNWNRAWSTSVGIDMRYPYFDYDLNDLSVRTTGKESAKDVSRRVAAQHLTHDMAFGPKVPQQMPINEWLRGPLLEPARERLNSLPAAMLGIFDQSQVSALLEEHARGGYHGWRLIELLTAASWFGQLDQ